MPALLTLATVRERLWSYCGQGVAYASRTPTQEDDATFRINQVCERFITSGKWRGTLRRIVIPVQDEYITLPRELGTILGIELISTSGRCCVSQIYTKFHEFAHGAVNCCSSGTYPISETAQTFITPTAPFTLRVKSTVTSGTISFIGGWDDNDDEYFGADTLNITNGSVDGTRTYNVMPPTGGIQKSVTTVSVELYSVDSSGTEELIAVYGPNETVPAYKRYRIPNRNSAFTDALVLGKLAYVEAVEDTDIIIPSHWGALKMGLKALQSEDTEEDEMALDNWKTCYDMLNNDLAEAEGDNEFPVFKVQPNFGCDTVINLV